MEHSKRLKLFETARNRYSVFLTSMLWKLTGDREIFTEALQYALFSIWRNVEKLGGDGAKSYIYRIALSANSVRTARCPLRYPIRAKAPRKESAERSRLRLSGGI